MKWKSAFVLLLTLILLCGSASAGVSSLDRALSGYLSVDDGMHYAMSAQIQSLLPYGDETVAMFNGVLRHTSIAASLREGETSMEVCMGGESLAALTERSVEDGTELTTPLLLNRTLTSAGSALDALAGQPASQPAKFDLFQAIEELEGCYQALTDAILPYAEEKKANYSIKNVGSSRWSRIARLTVEQSTELSPLIAAVLGCGMDEAYRSQLEGLTCSKNFVVGLYQTKQDGKDLAVYMKGYVTLADGKARALAFQWAFSEKEGVRVDTLKYEMVKSKTKVDFTREVHATLKRRADSQLVLDGECEIAVDDADGDVTTTHTYALSGKEKKGVRTIQGTVSEAVRTVEDGDSTTVTTTLTPDLKITSAEGSGVLSGSVGIQEKKDKTVRTELTLLFDEETARQLQEAARTGAFYAVEEETVPMPPSSLTQNVEIIITGGEPEEPDEEPERPADPADYLVGEPPIGMTGYDAPQEMVTVDLDSADEETLSALMGELTQNLAGRLLLAMTRLPEEDAALLRDNLSDENYALFLKLADGL